MGCGRPWIAYSIWIVTGVIMAWVAWASPHYPEGLWAPGHLSRYHTDIAECGSCHEPFRGPTPQKCLGCHTMSRFHAHSEPDVRELHQKVINTNENCLVCHTEHRGKLTAITIGRLDNPHGEIIFRATGAESCSDCHMMKSGEGKHGGPLLRNAFVQRLIQKGEGAHRPGHFARCLMCHRGGVLSLRMKEAIELVDS